MSPVDPTDYTGNSKHSKTEGTDTPAVEEKNIVKIIEGEVVIKKKSIGRKAKDLFIEADFKSTARNVVTDVLIPSAKNMMFDAVERYARNIFFGDTRGSRGFRSMGGYSENRSRFSYNSVSGNSRMGGNPINTSAREINRQRDSRDPDDYIVPTRVDAESVLEMMKNIIEKYEVVSVDDLNNLVGRSSTYTDRRFGWIDLRDSRIHQVREGWLIELPPAEAIPQ